MNSKTPLFRRARILNILINLVIAVIAAFLVLVLVAAVSMYMKSDVGESLQDKLGPLDLIFAAILACAYLFVAFIVRAIVKTTITGNPFVEENVSRLRLTWIIIALAEIVRMVLTTFINADSVSECVADSQLIGEVRLQVWILALFIAIMAEVFRLGLELRRDQELTV